MTRKFGISLPGLLLLLPMIGGCASVWSFTDTAQTPAVLADMAPDPIMEAEIQLAENSANFDEFIHVSGLAMESGMDIVRRLLMDEGPSSAYWRKLGKLDMQADRTGLLIADIGKAYNLLAKLNASANAYEHAAMDIAPGTVSRTLLQLEENLIGAMQAKRSMDNVVHKLNLSGDNKQVIALMIESYASEIDHMQARLQTYRAS